jgi:hypothetical protein
MVIERSFPGFDADPATQTDLDDQNQQFHSTLFVRAKTTGKEGKMVANDESAEDLLKSARGYAFARLRVRQGEIHIRTRVARLCM